MGGIPASVPSTLASNNTSSSYTKTIATTAASGDGKTATVFLAEAPNVSTGDKITISGVTPSAYNATNVLVSYFSDVYPYSVSYPSTATGDQTVAGTMTFTKTVYNSGNWGIVGKGGSALKNRDQGTVENSLRGQIQSSAGWSGASGTLFQNLDPNLPFPVALVKAIGQGIMRAAIGAVTTVAQVLDAIGTWFGNFVNSAGRIIGNIVDGVVDAAENTVQHFMNFMHHVFSGGRSTSTYKPISLNRLSVASGTARTALEVAEQAELATTATYNTQFSTETQSDFWNTPRILPAWLGNETDDVSFAQSLIDGTSTPASGTLVMIPVSASLNRTYDRIKFGINGTSMTSCFVGLYDVDESTGECTKVEDLGDVKSQLNTTYNLQKITLPTPRVVKKGELFYIGILQTGTPSALHRWSSSTNFSTGLFPRYIGNTYSVTGIGALPSTITNAQLLSGTKYWGALGVDTPAVAPPSVFFSDSFDRANSSSLGSSWVTRSGSGLSINSGNAYSGASATVSTYLGRAGSTAQEVGATFTPEISPRPSDPWIINSMLSLRGNGSGSFMYLRIYAEKFSSFSSPLFATTARLYSASSYSTGSDFSGGVPKGVSAYTSSENGSGTWTITASGENYVVRHNGNTVINWTDSGSFAFGSGHTEFGIGASQYTRLDNWYGKDL